MKKQFLSLLLLLCSLGVQAQYLDFTQVVPETVLLPEQDFMKLHSDDIGDIVAGDLDNDGDIDYVSFDAYGIYQRAKVYINDGNNQYAGSFVNMGSSFDYVYDVKKLADIDNDGDLDIIQRYTDRNFELLRVYFNDGAGHFTASSSSQNLGSHANYTNFYLSDFNNDGYLDILTFIGTHNLHIFLNNSLGTFMPSTSFTLNINSDRVSGTEILDYNNDGFPDIFVNDADSYVLINDGSGQFTQQNIQGTNFHDNVVYLKDIDNDNDFDAVVEVYENQFVDKIEFYTNDTNTFTLAQTLEVKTEEFFPMAFFDINTDGHIDIFPISTTVNNTPAMLNDGSGQFVFDFSNYLPFSNDTYSFNDKPINNYHLVDLDNDQDLDILLNGNPNLIMVNNNGKFITAGTIHIDRAEYATDRFINYQTNPHYKNKMKLDLADVDGDGFKDLLVCGRGVGNIPVTKLYKGTANGFDAIPYKYFRGLRSGKAMFADVNHDTYPDIIVMGSNFAEKTIAKYYLNDGAGNFTEHSYNSESAMSSYEIHDVEVANLNGDDYPDLIVSFLGYLPFFNTFINDGTGNDLGRINGTGTGYAYYNIFPFDANADGFDDVFIYHAYFLNNTSGQMYPSLELNDLDSTNHPAMAFDAFDIDNDGDTDLLVKVYVNLQGQSHRTMVYTNNGQGIFSLVDNPAFYELRFENTSHVDIDNDNDDDIFGIYYDATSGYRNFLYMNQSGRFNELVNNDFTTPNNTSNLDWKGEYFTDYVWDNLNADNLPDLVSFDLDNPEYFVIKYNNGVTTNDNLQFDASDYIIPRMDEDPTYNTQDITNFLTNNAPGATISYYHTQSDAENQTDPLPNTFVNTTQQPMPIVARFEQANNTLYYAFNLNIDPPVYVFHPNILDVGNDLTEDVYLDYFVDRNRYFCYHSYNDALNNQNGIFTVNPFTLTQPETTIWFTDKNHHTNPSPMKFTLLNSDDYAYNVQRVPFNLYVVNSQSTTLNLDDRYTQPIDLGFGFNYFNNSSNQLLIGDNGVVSFDLNKAGGYCSCWSTDPIPNTDSNEKNAIYGVYQDVDNSVGTGTIGYSHIGTAPFRKFIAFYHQTPLYTCSNTTMTSQIVLYETYNFIDVQVGERTPCTNWNNGNGVLGIIDITGGNAYTPPGRNTSAWTATDEAWRFRPDFSFPDFQYIICDANGDGHESFDLSVIQNHYSGSTVSIHLSNEDAEASMNPITGNYTNITTAQTLYLRIFNGSTTEIKNVLIAAIDCNADYDIDGVPTNTEDINANGNYGDDDTDNDGIPDFVDDDDDGDMVLTQFELVNPRPNPRTVNSYSDTDGDGTPNYLDDDDDGDGTLTVNEDYDGDGNPSNDDINNNGIPDYLDDQVTANLIYLPDSAIHIYPIPAKDRLHIDFNIDITDAKMKLFTQDGKLIQQEMLHTSQNLIALPETKGIYYLKILTDKGEMNKPIIVK